MRESLVSLLTAFVLAVFSMPLCAGPGTWLRKARIAGPDLWYGMTDKQLRSEIDAMAEQGVNALDLDFSGETIERQLEMVNRILNYARSAHPKLRFFVYQAPLESVSYNVDKNRDGRVDPGKRSTYSEHPEWAQLGLDGEPALFYGADANAFWVGKHDEDVWLCPNDPAYKLIWKDHLRRLAATGVDAIYIDVPFFRGWFDDKRGWGFACACPDCAAIYKSQYGSALPAKINWKDANFRRFVRFRFDQIAEFVAQARKAVRSGNRKTRLIIEHWDGITDAFETGCDPAMIARFSDARCHEWSRESSSRYHRYTWLEDIVRYLVYRAMDGNDPAWILAYTDEGDSDRMRALAAMQLAAGCNFWETEAPDMAGSVDVDARTELFNWIASAAKTYYNKKLGVYTDVGLYYSSDSIVFRDFREHMEPWDCASEFLGLGMIMLQQHVPFRVILPGEIEGISVLVLPNVACLSDAEAAAIKAFADAGGVVVATGETGDFDEDGQKRKTNALADLYSAPAKAVRTKATYGVDYHDAVSTWSTKPNSEPKANKARSRFAKKVWSKMGREPLLSLVDDPFLIVLPWQSKKELQLRFFNCAGVDGAAGSSVQIGVRLPSGKKAGSVRYIPYLGDPQPLTLSWDSGYMTMQVSPSLHGVAVIKLKK